MVKSMTGYGRCRKTVGDYDIAVEIKAVNNRYYECGVKISRAFMYLEDKIKAYIQSCGIVRGKIDIFITIDVPEGNTSSIELDKEYASAYIDALKKLRDEFGLYDDISTMRVAQNRDIFSVKKLDDDIEGEWEALKEVLDEAVVAFDSARAAEGQRLISDILLKRKNIEERIAIISEKAPQVTEEYENRLYTKLKEVLSENDITTNESRIITECALFADRVAIDEELVRLGSHMKSFDECVESGGPIGRRLDFQIQEINREVNTIGSKCQSSEIARYVVDIKSELEKIREQIQNIE